MHKKYAFTFALLCLNLSIVDAQPTVFKQWQGYLAHAMQQAEYGKYQQAEDLWIQVEKEFSETDPAPEGLTRQELALLKIECFQGLGFLYNLTGYYKKAGLYFEKAAQFLPLVDENSLEVAHYYENKATYIFESTNQINWAVLHYLKALDMKQQLLPKASKEVLRTRSLLSIQLHKLYLHQFSYTWSLKIAQENIRLYEEKGWTDDLYYGQSLRAMGLYHTFGHEHYPDNASLKQGRFYFQKALNLYQRVVGENHHYTAYAFHNMGNYYNFKGKLNLEDIPYFFTYRDSASQAQTKSANIRKQVFHEQHPYIAVNHYLHAHDLAILFGKTRTLPSDYPESLDELYQANELGLRVFLPELPRGEEPRDVLPYFKEVPYPRYMAMLLFQKQDILSEEYAMYTPDSSSVSHLSPEKDAERIAYILSLKDTVKAKHIAMLRDSVTKVAKQYQDFQNRPKVSQQYQDLYLNAILLSAEVGNRNTYLKRNLIEEEMESVWKSHILQYIQDDKVRKRMAQMQSHWPVEEYNAIKLLEEEYRGLFQSANPESLNKLTHIGSQLVERYTALEPIEDNKNLMQPTEEIEACSLASLQQQLTENTAIFYIYFGLLNAHTLFSARSILVTQDTIAETAMFPYESDLNSSVIDSLHTYIGGGRKRQYVAKYGYKLYQELIEPLEPLLEGNRRLILSTNTDFPWQALPTDRSEEPRYLGEKYNMTGEYTVESRLDTAFVKLYQPALALAPYTPADTPLGMGLFAYTNAQKQKSSAKQLLFLSKEEIHAMEKYLRTVDKRYRKSATEAEFKKLCRDYSIIHFTTHSESIPLSGDTLFQVYLDLMAGKGEDGQLHAYEIEGLPLQNTEIVVLSSCSSGKYSSIRSAHSSGYFPLLEHSLVDAALRAGAKAAVGSYWDVNEYATKEIMTRFYYHISQKEFKDVALWKAQQDYLQNEEIPKEMKQPHYWAGFFVKGNLRPIEFVESPIKEWQVWAGIFVFITLVCFWEVRT